jgi:hypothetical protein
MSKLSRLEEIRQALEDQFWQAFQADTESIFKMYGVPNDEPLSKPLSNYERATWHPGKRAGKTQAQEHARQARASAKAREQDEKDTDRFKALAIKMAQGKARLGTARSIAVSLGIRITKPYPQTIHL